MSPRIEWNPDPLILAALASYLGIYVWRWRHARAEAGPRGASWWRLASFATGVAMLFAALVSPISGLGEQLFVFHMAQHILLADLAAIFLILGLTKVILRPVTARVHHLERKAGFLAHPVFAVALYVANLWVWHIPAMYQASLNYSAVHAVQHLTFSAVALLFWWHLLSPIRSRRRLEGMGTTFYVTGAKLLTGLLASALTFAPVFLYDYYVRQPDYWGLGPGEDQSLAGALMMVEESFILGVAFVVLFIRMLGESEREQERLERYETTP